MSFNVLIFPIFLDKREKTAAPTIATICMIKIVTIRFTVGNSNSLEPKIPAIKIRVCTPTLNKKKEIKNFFNVG